GAAADDGASVKTGPGLDPRVCGDLDFDVDPGGGRVDHGDAGEHVPFEDAPPRLGLDGGEVGAVVDAHRHGKVLGEVGHDRVPGRAHRRQHVGKVVLPLGVVAGDLPQRLGEPSGVEGVGTRVDLADRELLGGGVAGGLG